jgi:hypothetical protein
LRANELPYWLCQLSLVLASGSGPVLSEIADGCAGMAIGVILSSSAIAGWAEASAIRAAAK